MFWLFFNAFRLSHSASRKRMTFRFLYFFLTDKRPGATISIVNVSLAQWIEGWYWSEHTAKMYFFRPAGRYFILFFSFSTVSRGIFLETFTSAWSPRTFAKKTGPFAVLGRNARVPIAYCTLATELLISPVPRNGIPEKSLNDGLRRVGFEWRTLNEENYRLVGRWGWFEKKKLFKSRVTNNIKRFVENRYCAVRMKGQGPRRETHSKLKEDGVELNFFAFYVSRKTRI